MAVLARGQITITDMRNEGTYTFVRYSDDGGKTFTAASQAALDEVQAGLPLEGRNFILKSNFLIKVDNAAFASGYYSILPVANKELLKDKTLAFSYLLYRKGESEQGTGSLGNRFGMHGYIKYTNSQTGDSYINYPFTTYLAKDNDGTRVVENYVIRPKSGYVVDSISINVQPKAKPAEGNNEIWLLGYPKLELGDTATPWTPAPEDCTFGTTTGKYMGTAVWDKPYPPLDPSEYTWSEVQGRGVASIVRYFGLSNSGAVEPKTYDTTPKSPTPTDRYLWGYDLVTYTDGTAVQMPHQVIAVYGDKGDKGDKGVNGTDAVNIIPDPAQIIVDTDDKGMVEDTEGANSVIRAYRGGTQITCSATVKSTSKGIVATVTSITDGGITTPQISISIANDPDTGYAYASGYVDLDVVADKKTYKTRLTVGTNIHKVTAKLVKKTDSISLDVSGVTDKFEGYKTQTDAKFIVTDGLIENTVSNNTFNENNERISTEIRQTADSISLAVQNGTRPNLLWGSDLNLDGVDTTDKAAIVAHLGVGLNNNLKTDDTHFRYLHGQGIDGSDAMYFKNDPAAGVEFPGLFWEKVNGAVRNLKLKRNTKYTVSAWIKFAPPQDGQLGVYNCEAFATNSETDAERVARYDVEGQYQSDSVSEWKRVVFKFTTGEYDYAAVTILTSGEGICELWICRPKLEEGDSATPWCEYDGTEEGLRRTGINIETGEITLDAKNTIVKENLTTKRLLTTPTYAGGPYAEIYGSEFLIKYGNGKKGAQFGIGDDGLLHLIFFDADGKAVGDLGPGGWSKLIDATKEAKWTKLRLKDITGSKNINDVINVGQQSTTVYYRFTAARNSELDVVGSNAEYDNQVFKRENDFTDKIPDGWYVYQNDGEYNVALAPYQPLPGETTPKIYYVTYYWLRNGKLGQSGKIYFAKNASGEYYRTDSNGNDMSDYDGILTLYQFN